MDAVLRQLTLEEKASLCLGSDLWHTAAVPRLGIAAAVAAMIMRYKSEMPPLQKRWADI